MGNRRILIAGAGIAGLTAALAFASRGFSVKVLERADAFEPIGAGIQLSPNATRTLDRLGVLDLLRPVATAPQAVVLKRATSLGTVARVPLGEAVTRRWGAPYLTVHRADLHDALLTEATRSDRIDLLTGATATDIDLTTEQPALAFERDGEAHSESAHLVIAADGVRSAVRGLMGQSGRSRFVGQIAWRRTVAADAIDPGLIAGDVVTAFLHPRFHLIAYPVHAGRDINLVAFTRSKRDSGDGWAQALDAAPLRSALASAAPALASLAKAGTEWTAWPIHVADLDGAWVHPAGLALIGDAAHAMTPFAAQGAAMAIEDAETLATAVSGGADLATALHAWATERRRRVLKVARRGMLNEFTWHARGPIALGRDMVLKALGPERLAAQLDWLYGFDPDAKRTRS